MFLVQGRYLCITKNQLYSKRLNVKQSNREAGPVSKSVQSWTGMTLYLKCLSVSRRLWRLLPMYFGICKVLEGMDLLFLNVKSLYSIINRLATPLSFPVDMKNSRVQYSFGSTREKLISPRSAVWKSGSCMVYTLVIEKEDDDQKAVW